MTGARGARWTGTGGGGHRPVRPRPWKPGLKLSLRDDDSLWREPRWNADGRAPFAKGELYRKVQRIRISVLRRPASFFCLRSHSWLEALIVTAPATTACAF